MEPSSSEPCGRFSLITLKKAHARNTVMIFSRPLNLSLTPESFLPNKWPLSLSLPIIIEPVCVCVCAHAGQTALLATIYTINRLCHCCLTSRREAVISCQRSRLVHTLACPFSSLQIAAVHLAAAATAARPRPRTQKSATWFESRRLHPHLHNSPPPIWGGNRCVTRW